MIDDTLQQLIGNLRAGRPDFTGPPLEVRANFEKLLSTLPVAEDIQFIREDLGGVPTLRATTTNMSGDSALLYLHGGAYIAGSAYGYRGLAAELGRAAALTTYAIDYRLAPEHRFPAAVDDAVAAFMALLSRGIDAKRIVIAGDSAGGGLALATLVALRDRGVALPAAGLLVSPWANLACDGTSVVEKAQDDPALTGEGLLASAAHYLGATNPRMSFASPIYANLAGLPPLMIQVGSAEILLDDAFRVARAAADAGVDVNLEVWADMFHVWHAFSFLLAAGRKAIERAGAFARRSIS